MAQDINLLPEQTGEDKQQGKQQKLIIKISTIVLAVTILVVVGLFATKLAISAQQASVDKDLAVQEQRIQAKKTEEGIYRTLNDKLTSLSSFFATQKQLSFFLAEFSDTVPNSMTLTDLSLEEGNVVSITGRVTSYADLAGFFEKLRAAGPSDPQSSASAAPTASATPYFTNPAILTITRDEQSGSISFTAQFGLSPQLLAGQPTGVDQ